MSGVNVSGLKAGQRVRVTYEGVVSSSGGAGKWTVPDPTSCTAIVLDDGHITSVEVLREPTPEWVSQPGEVVREGLITWVRQGSTWVAAEPHDLFASDQRIWQDVQHGVAVRLVPEPTP